MFDSFQLKQNLFVKQHVASDLILAQGQGHDFQDFKPDVILNCLTQGTRIPNVNPETWKDWELQAK